MLIAAVIVISFLAVASLAVLTIALHRVAVSHAVVVTALLQSNRYLTLQAVAISEANLEMRKSELESGGVAGRTAPRAERPFRPDEFPQDARTVVLNGEPDLNER